MTMPLNPIFDPEAWDLSQQQAELCEKARVLAAENFAPRAAEYDKTASFPTENYKDLAQAGLQMEV